MRILDEQNIELTETEIDLTIGTLMKETIIRSDADPVDDITKFAYANEDYETILRYVVIPEEQKNATRIAELKQQLSDTDYAVIKIAEGAATLEEYADIINQRSQWRKEINDLEIALEQGGG